MTPQDILSSIQDLTGIRTNPAMLESQMRLQLIELHASFNSYRDLVVAEISLGDANRVVTFNIPDVLVGFRKFRKIVDQNGQEVQLVTADYAMSNMHMKHKFWVAGNTFSAKFSIPVTQLTVSYYKHPIVTPITESDSWIMAEYPMVLVYKIAQIQTIGDQTMSAQMRELFLSAYQVAFSANLDPNEGG